MKQFDELTDLLAVAAADISAAELHGLLTGVFVVGSTPQQVNWQQNLSSSVSVLEDSAELCAEVNKIIKQLENNFQELSFKFDLLLPDDNADITFRTRCLALWCTGFLAGVGLGNVDVESSKVLKEVLNDFASISQASATGDANEEDEEEAAFVELLEYVKVAVQNVHIEMGGAKKTGEQTLH